MKKILYVINICLCIIFLLSGCGKEEVLNTEPGISLVIIAGRHANAKMYTDDVLKRADELLEASITYSGEEGDYSADIKVSIIVCDGNPTQITLDEIELTREASNTDKIKERAEGSIKKLKELLRSDTLIADDEEVDLAAAVNQARLILKENPGSENHILILDTGVTTDGKINMNEFDIMAVSTEEILNHLEEGAFCDLEGINVTFKGLGNVAGSQKEYYEEIFEDTTFQKRLAEFWTQYFVDKCGATLVDGELAFASAAGESMLYSEDDPEGYPYVTTVDFKMKDKETEKETEKATEKETEKETETTIDLPPLSAQYLGFMPESDEFRNEKTAIAKLAKYAEIINAYIAKYPDQIFYVVGSIAKTAEDADQDTSQVSQKRADRIKAILVNNYGVHAENLVVIDAGTRKFSWRNAEEFPKGSGSTGNSAAKEANRVVAIIHESQSEFVEELIEEGCLE